MTAPNKMAKRAAAGTLALAVCFTGGVLSASVAQAANGFKFDQRLGGADRFETAVNASKQAFDAAGDVIVVQDDALADGLTASYLAGVKKAPILYVKKNEVPSVTAAEIERLKAERVYIVGGTSVVSDGVKNSLGSIGRTVTRIGGTDRFDTAAKVATSDSNDVGTVFIANGDAPADALAAGPIAYASTNPILLVRAMEVPASTKAALNQLNEDNRIVLGGNAVVSTSTYADLAATERLSGKDRQGTAVAIADYATKNEGFSKANAALVGSEDRNTADALIAAPLLGQTKTPILFTTRGGLGTTSKTYLTDHVGDLTGKGYVFGGNAAVPQSVADEATEAAGGTATPTTPPPTSGSSIAVAETTTSTQVLQADANEQTARDDNRIYEASGLKAGKEYRITLVDSANIKVTGSNVTFLSSSDANATSKFSADVGVNYANIVRVNGAATGATGLDNPGTPANGGTPAVAGTNVRTFTAVPVDGKISFEIDGAAVGSVTPVVYLNGGPARTQADGGLSIRLETQATDVGQFAAAAEPFGLGGIATYSGTLAPSAAITAAPVASVDKDGESFSTDPAGGAPSYRYTFDDNDTFTIGAAAVDLQTFKSQLSSGDTIGGTFQQDVSKNSTFNLTDTNPVQPAAPTVTRSAGSQTAITIEGTIAGNKREADQLVIQRAPVGANDAAMVGGFNTIATVDIVDIDTTSNGLQYRYVDQGVPAGNYQYRVAVINDGDQGIFSTMTATTGVSADGPTVLDTRLVRAAGNPSNLDLNATDVFQVVASGDLDDPAVGDVLRVQDGDGSTADIRNTVAFDSATDTGAPTTPPAGTTFRLNTTSETVGGVSYPAGRVLTVRVGTGDPAPLTGGTAGSTDAGRIAGIQLPATIINSGGITNKQGAKVVLTGDVIIDDEG